MDGVKMVLQICGNSIRKSLYKPRIYLAFLMVAFLMLDFSDKLKTFSQLVDVPVSPWVLPFFAGNTGNQIFIVLGALLIFCDAPFLNPNSYMQIVRCGRKRWFWGTMLYIWVQSMIYAAGLFLLSVALLLPRVRFMTGWGKVLGTLTQTAAGSVVSMRQLDYYVIAEFTPLQALFLVLTVICLNGVLVGVLNYALNLWIKNGSGTIASALLVLSPLLLTKLVPEEIAHYFAPPVWMDLTLCSWNGYGDYASPLYIYLCLFFLVGAFVVISYVGIRRKDLSVVEEL